MYAPRIGGQQYRDYDTITSAQMGFIDQLSAERGIAAAGPISQALMSAEVSEIADLNKQQASRLITALKSTSAAPTSAGPQPSERQMSFIESLLATKDLRGTQYALWLLALPDLSRSEASNAIEALKALPKVSTSGTPARTDLVAGVYTDGETIYRVYLGQQSRRMLAKKIVGDREAGYHYEYAGAAERFVSDAFERMTLAQAKEWGRATNTCVKCGARLDDPESVDAGIGPVCAKRDWA